MTILVYALGLIGTCWLTWLVTRRLERHLHRPERCHARAARAANDGFWDWNLRTEQVYFSPRWKAMLGFGPDELSSHPDEWLDRLHPEDADGVRGKLDRHFDGSTAEFACELRMLHRDGDYRYFLARGRAVHDELGQRLRFSGTQMDITERKRLEKRLLHNATHDPLTDLPNRVLCVDRLNRALELTRRESSFQFAVLHLNLDRFKTVNQSLGHQHADDLLLGSARRLGAFTRGTDTVARLGSDEFVILVENIADVSDAIRVADRVMEAFAQPFRMLGQELFVSTSVGIVLSETGYSTPEEMLRDASAAVSRAKARGGSTYEIFDEAMRDRMMNRLHMESELHRAIEREELVVHYQPIVELETARLVGLEALVRWMHPQRGMIPPLEFIGLAEASSLIVPLDRWVLREACRQTQQWGEQFPGEVPLTIAVNFSTKQLTQPDLVEYVGDVLEQTGLAPTNLRLELTESAFLDHSEAILDKLEALRKLGVLLKIDDFGTGYSSLSYLHRLPIDILKIDRSFIRNLDHSGTDLAIAHAIVLLAQALDMQTIAEGVETDTQAAQLRELRCELAQGYLFSKPLDPAGIERLLAQGRLSPLPVSCTSDADPEIRI